MAYLCGPCLGPSRIPSPWCCSSVCWHSACLKSGVEPDLFPQLTLGRKAGRLDAEMLGTQLSHCVQLVTVTRRVHTARVQDADTLPVSGLLARACRPLRRLGQEDGQEVEASLG